MITLDAKELMKLNEGFKKYGAAIQPAVAKKAFREAARPMLTATRNLVPVGSVIAPMGWGKNKGPAFARGGYTRRDVRLKFVPPIGDEVARVAIGVSKAGSDVGWRTHFITRGWTDRGGTFHRGKDFLTEAYDNTIEVVQDNFYKTLFSNLLKWGKENLPQ